MQNQQLLALRTISKSYGTRRLLDSVSLLVNRADRIGLVGENGAGKTTLGSIAAGLLAPDEGTRSLAPGLRVGFLPQEANLTDETSVQAYFEGALGGLDQLQRDLTRLEARMAEPDLAPAALAEVMDQYGAVLEQYTARGGYDLDTRLDQVLAGLDLSHIDRARPMHSLSGGEKTRAMLAGLLIAEPELLILDEPTNHLDIAAVEWLESYLRGYPGALLLISHDRRFLNEVVTQIAEFKIGVPGVLIFHGNYEAYVAERERLRDKQQAAFETQQEEKRDLQRKIKMSTHNVKAPAPPKDGDKMLYDFKGGGAERTRARQIRDLRERLDEIEKAPIERPTRRWQIDPEFNPAALGSHDVIRLEGVTKRYGERTILDDVSAVVAGKQRVVLQGPNGLGKTTFLRLVLGLEAPDCGTVRLATGAQVGYLDQEQESLPPERTVIEEFRQGLDMTEPELRAALHKYGLFKEAQVFQPIRTLSIGMRRRLQIARIIATGANLLILDEPTNHLDLDSVEQFESALVDFPGTVLATSHDRYFIERVATQVWTFREGKLVVLRGA